MSDLYVPKIRQLPGADLSPETVLARTLDKRAHIKAVGIVIQWDDETYEMDWSQMAISEMCMMLCVFQKIVSNKLVPED